MRSAFVTAFRGASSVGPFVSSVPFLFRCFLFPAAPGCLPLSFPPRFSPPGSRPPCWVYCPVSYPALVCTAFLSKCCPLIWVCSCFTVALCSTFLGFEFRFSGFGVCCGSFCLVCWEVLHVCSNGHFLSCFTFYLTLRSTIFTVHNQLSGLWFWDSPYCLSLLC